VYRQLAKKAKMKIQNDQNPKFYAKDLNYLESLEHILDHLENLEINSNEDVEPFLSFAKPLDALIFNEEVLLQEAKEANEFLEEHLEKSKLNYLEKLEGLREMEEERELIIKNIERLGQIKLKNETLEKKDDFDENSEVDLVERSKELKRQCEEMENKEREMQEQVDDLLREIKVKGLL
jgi:hypothetical protein